MPWHPFSVDILSIGCVHTCMNLFMIQSSWQKRSVLYINLQNISLNPVDYLRDGQKFSQALRSSVYFIIMFALVEHGFANSVKQILLPTWRERVVPFQFKCRYTKDMFVVWSVGAAAKSVVFNYRSTFKNILTFQLNRAI